MSAVGLLIMAVLFVHELRFYLETVTVHEASMHAFSIAHFDLIYFHLLMQFFLFFLPPGVTWFVFGGTDVS